MGFSLVSAVLFFFNDTATTEIYTLSLHDALPICGVGRSPGDAIIEADGLAQPQPRGERFGWCDRIEVALEAEHGAVPRPYHVRERTHRLGVETLGEQARRAAREEVRRRRIVCEERVALAPRVAAQPVGEVRSLPVRRLVTVAAF